MGDSGWFLKVQSDNSKDFCFTTACFVSIPPAFQCTHLHGHNHLRGAQQNGTGTKVMEMITCVELKILTFFAMPVISTDEKHSVTGGYCCLYYIPHLFKNQGKVKILQDFSIRVCITISKRTLAYLTIHLPFWLCCMLLL